MKITVGLLIIITGIISNSFTLIVLKRKRFKQFPARNIFCGLALADTLKLASLILLYFIDFQFESMSELGCRVQAYIEAFTTALPMFLITYSSVEKFFFIKYSKLKLYRNLTILLIVCFTFIYSAIYPALVSFVQNPFINYNFTSPNNNSNKTLAYKCSIPSISYIVEAIFSVLISFLITFKFSCLLIYAILESRLKILRLTSPHDIRRLNKDIVFAITTLIINITHLLLHLPLFTYFLLNRINSVHKIDSVQQWLSDLQNIAFCINFYILVMSNSIFRKEFLHMLCVKKRNTSRNALN